MAPPSPSKVLHGGSIYLSYELPITHGGPVITDYESASLEEVNEQHPGGVMSAVYPALETVVGADWNSKIDIWSLRIMVR